MIQWTKLYALCQNWYNYFDFEIWCIYANEFLKRPIFNHRKQLYNRIIIQSFLLYRLPKFISTIRSLMNRLNSYDSNLCSIKKNQEVENRAGGGGDSGIIMFERSGFGLKFSPIFWPSRIFRTGYGLFFWVVYGRGIF